MIFPTPLSDPHRCGRARKRFLRLWDWGWVLLLVWVGGFRAVGDPVAEALADPRKFVIEMEDYDFDGGKSRPSASVMPYSGGDYEGLAGIPGVDFSRAAVAGFLSEYRSGDSPVVPIFEQGSETRLNRGTWKMFRNYSLAYNEAGQWFNYTRQFLRGGYRIWIAAASPDVSSGGIRGRLQRVITGAGTANTLVEDLGFVDAPGSGGWGTLALVPLQTSFGNWLDLGGGGGTTLRYLPERGDVDFILLQFVAFIEPAAFLRAELDVQGRPTLRVQRGFNRPTGLQGAVGLQGADSEWKEIAWDFNQPFVIPEDSEFRFFRLRTD